MPECAIGQPPWQAAYEGGFVGAGFSPQQACSALGSSFNAMRPTTGFYWNGTACAREGSSVVVVPVQSCTPPTIEPGEVGPINLAAACPASAPCVFSMFTDGSIPAEVTPATVTVAFAFGLGAVLTLWSIGYVIGIATGLIKKA